MSRGVYKRTMEHNAAISKAQRALGNKHWSKRPEVIAKRVASMNKYWNDIEFRKRLSEIAKRRMTPEFREKMSIAHKGQHSSPETQFKRVKIHAHEIVGGKNQYRNIHKWVEKQLGKPNKCSKCGKIAHGRQIHWANKSKQYLKDTSDWVRLCVRCHYYFDPNRVILPVGDYYY